jgi:murein DD-endopeptidase MepM/ murein hydrolase activator NlpD
VLTQPGRFNLLIVSGDGRWVLRLYLPRPLAWTGLALLAATVVTSAAVLTDYLALARQRGTVAALRGRAGEHDRLLDATRERLAEIQTEMASWRGLHARIWEPFGPEAHGIAERSGVGGVGRPVTEPGAGSSALAAQLEQLAAVVGDEGQKLRALERLMSRAGKTLAALPSRWPIRGVVNSEFGRRISPWTGAPEHHGGLDIAAEIGTPVKAPAPGVVVFAGPMPDYGTTLVLDHGSEIKTLYGHLQKIQVLQGQKVERGQQIALSGNTGRTSGPHLHYEISVRGQPVNPRGYLWDVPVAAPRGISAASR